jgi:hypothetical protein
MSKIRVFRDWQNPDEDKPWYYIKRENASEIVVTGKAVWLDKHAIQLQETHRDVAVSSVAVSKSNRQGAIYELAAIDKNRQYYSGGLNRTEKQPRSFVPMAGAKVGHQ